MMNKTHAPLADARDTTILDNLPEAVLVIDPINNRIVETNAAATQLFDRPDPQLRAMRVSELFASDLARLIAFTQEVMAQGYGWSNELHGLHAQRGLISIECSASCRMQQQATYMVMLLRDRQQLETRQEQAEANTYHRRGIIEWKRIEDIFQDIERENQLLLRAVGEGIYGVNADGRTTFLNPAAEQMLGYNAEELIGKDIHTMIHHSKADGAHYPSLECPIFAAFHDGVVHCVDDEVFWRKDGTPIHVEYTSTPIEDHGHLVGAVVVFRDISDRKLAEARLRDALHEVSDLKHRLELENEYLQEEIRSEYHAREIVGDSVAIQRLLNQIPLVAPTDTSVLITGESGTGKELIARAIHEASERRHRPLIRVNCAAIPRELFESEFFGHVKGAFTGAHSDRAGRFELADGGTLFLDEVGEIPLELQSKLLRVLQEGQFERVGESRTRDVDVRVIAATNQNLFEEVQQKNFREDLYFRLNVFPVESVPLRARLDDIPLLAMHFLRHFTQKLNKPGIKLSQADIIRLQSYDWPGNIRELENVIERAVILSRNNKLVLDIQQKKWLAPTGTAPRGVSTDGDPAILSRDELRAQERDNILRALHKTRGKIFGDDGAARLLNMKATTLASKLQRWGIDKRRFARSTV
ncbi:MAG: sigma 54-interacting transcriptional regulator [Gammaproteobacteria bacterium]